MSWPQLVAVVCRDRAADASAACWQKNNSLFSSILFPTPFLSLCVTLALLTRLSGNEEEKEGEETFTVTSFSSQRPLEEPTSFYGENESPLILSSRVVVVAEEYQ